MIRKATKDDIKDILDIYNYAILNTTASYDYKTYTIEMRTKWYNEKIKNNEPIIVFEIEDKVVGLATFGEFRDKPGYKYTIEHSVYVHKDYRNCGIGTKLMKELIKIAREREYKLIVAGIDSENKGSIEMHIKLGFEYAGTIKKAGYKFRRWLDISFYQLELEGPSNPIEI